MKPQGDGAIHSPPRRPTTDRSVHTPGCGRLGWCRARGRHPVAWRLVRFQRPQVQPFWLPVGEPGLLCRRTMQTTG